MSSCETLYRQRKSGTIHLFLVLVVAVCVNICGTKHVSHCYRRRSTQLMTPWMTDGSAELEILKNGVSCTKGGGNPHNAMYTQDGGVSSGEHYWQFHFDELENNGAFVGITTLNKFASGYYIQALCYGGNLSDGVSLLVLNFGPGFAKGDTVGMLVSYQGSNCSVYFDHNGRNLGLAFTVPADKMRDAYPVVHFLAPGVVVCKKLNEVPTNRTRTPIEYESVLGVWRLTNLQLKNSSVSLPKQPTIQVRSGGPGVYLIFAHIINFLEFKFQQQDDQTWQGSSVMTTLMNGPPNELLLEAQMIHLFKSMSSMALDLDGHLICMAASTGLHATFERYDDSPKPYEGDPFNR